MDSPAPIVAEVYAELRRLAQQYLSAERKDHTLQATALVHEAFARLQGPREVPWQNRAHYYAAAAQAMRRILIDHARARGSQKRGGSRPGAKVALEMVGLPDLAQEDQREGFLILEEAISRLEEIDPEVGEVVRLRYFAGLSVEQVAEALGVSAPTVKRRWEFARAWLKDTLERADGK